jgi:hypothetical protein
MEVPNARSAGLVPPGGRPSGSSVAKIAIRRAQQRLEPVEKSYAVKAMALCLDLRLLLLPLRGE